jgi:hypothetical protein
LYRNWIPEQIRRNEDIRVIHKQDFQIFFDDDNPAILFGTFCHRFTITFGIKEVLIQVKGSGHDSGSSSE